MQKIGTEKVRVIMDSKDLPWSWQNTDFGRVKFLRDHYIG